MFSTICYIISIICFITTFGCHATLKNGNPTDYPGYMLSPLLSSIPYISGFILAVIPECLVFDIAWYWMFLINTFIVIILGPIITKFYLVRMVSGKGLGVDAFISLLIAIVFFNFRNHIFNLNIRLYEKHTNSLNYSTTVMSISNALWLLYICQILFFYCFLFNGIPMLP